MADYQTYATKEDALAAKLAVARALGCQERDLVIVRWGDKFRIRTREGLQRRIASKGK